MYQKMNPNLEPEVYDFIDILDKIFEIKSEFLEFNLEEIKQILSSLSIVQLNENMIKDEVTNKSLFEMSFSDKNGFKFIKEYILQMLDKSDDFTQEIMKDLTNKKYRQDTILENEQLNDFCREHIIEAISFIRLVDFGNFMIHKLTHNSFNNISDTKLKEFEELKIRSSKFSDTIIESLKGANIHLGHARLAMHIYHYRFSENYNELRSFLFAQNLILENMYNIMFSSQIKPIIEQSMNIMIENGRNNNLNNSIQW